MRTFLIALATSATIFATGLSPVAASEYRYCLQGDDYACQGERLWDGSYLVQVQRSKDEPLPEPLTLRIIEYRLDPQIAEPLAQLQRSRGRQEFFAAAVGVGDGFVD